MTNKEYIEKNNISFSEAMEMYDNKKYPCINDWLSQEHQEHKFKVGDFVTLSGNIGGIGIVIDVKDKVYYKFLRRDGTFHKWGSGNHEVFNMIDEDAYEKIF